METQKLLTDNLSPVQKKEINFDSQDNKPNQETNQYPDQNLELDVDNNSSMQSTAKDLQNIKSIFQSENEKNSQNQEEIQRNSGEQEGKQKEWHQFAVDYKGQSGGDWHKKNKLYVHNIKNPKKIFSLGQKKLEKYKKYDSYEQNIKAKESQNKKIQDIQNENLMKMETFYQNLDHSTANNSKVQKLDQEFRQNSKKYLKNIGNMNTSINHSLKNKINNNNNNEQKQRSFSLGQNFLNSSINQQNIFIMQQQNQQRLKKEEQEDEDQQEEYSEMVDFFPTQLSSIGELNTNQNFNINKNNNNILQQNSLISENSYQFQNTTIQKDENTGNDIQHVEYRSEPVILPRKAELRTKKNYSVKNRFMQGRDLGRFRQEQIQKQEELDRMFDMNLRREQQKSFQQRQLKEFKSVCKDKRSFSAQLSPRLTEFLDNKQIIQYVQGLKGIQGNKNEKKAIRTQLQEEEIQNSEKFLFLKSNLDRYVKNMGQKRNGSMGKINNINNNSINKQQQGSKMFPSITSSRIY